MSSMVQIITDFLLWLLKLLGWKEPKSWTFFIKPKIYVIAANRVHVDHWCRISGLNSRNDAIIYVSSPKLLYGVDPDSAIFIFYETWRDHPNAHEIEQQVINIKNKHYEHRRT